MFRSKLNLWNVIVIAICLVGMTMFLGCDKEKNNDANFYNLEYRIGLWINSDRKDTLEFVNSSQLVRKEEVYTFEEYLYRIENNTLFISLPNSESNIETQHSVLKIEKDIVVLGNMYPTFGFGDNSGTFKKR